MAAPSYTTDLTTILDFDGTSGTAAEPSTGWTAGRSPTNADTDFPIQGTTHASLTMNTTGDAGILATGSTFTWTSGNYLFGWIIWLAPGAIDTKANGGLAMLCGSSTSAYKVFYVGGKDYGLYPYGGWQNFAVDPTLTHDEIFGSPTGYYVVGAGARVLSSVAKGNPLGFDAFRYGRGELRVAQGESGNYATFAGMAAANDASTARWGLFQAIDGGYKFKGLMVLGYGALVNFVDANKSIVVDITTEVNSTFNKIEIRNASSSVSWENISITNLGVTGTYTTASRCAFQVVDNATVNLANCTFTDMDTFAFQSNSTLTDCTWRRCNTVTAGGASFTGCLFTNSTAAASMSATTLNVLDDCRFVSDGSNHAVDLGTISSTTSMNWNCTASGYAGTNGSTGNETIKVNVASGQTLTINVGAGYTTPTYYNTGTGTVTVVSGQVTTTITVRDVITNAVIQGARVYLVAGSGGPLSQGTVIFNDVTDSNGQVTDIRSLAADQPVTGWARKSSSSPYYKTGAISATIDNATGLDYTVLLIKDE